MDSDVIVIGAGLAGLQSARRLEQDGRHVIVLEAADAVGGRIRTDIIDGYRVDRGFQVLNPAYPALYRDVDVPALDLQSFGVGAVVRDGQRSTTLAHPLRHPRYALGTLLSAHTPPSDLVALARWLGPTLLRVRRPVRSATDETLRASLDRAGLTGRLRRDVLDTFLAGVLSDTSGGSSARYVKGLLRYFVLGAPGLPRDGMQALPEQLAAGLRVPVRLDTAARGVHETSGGVEVTTDAGVLTARAVIAAAGPHEAPGLADIPAPVMNGLTTWWFCTPESPLAGRFLMLDASGPGGGPAGPIWNTAVMSEVAPSYAPPGGHLVQATTLLDRPDGLASESEIRRDLERLYRTSTDGWDVIARHVVPHTLPAEPPPLVDRGPVWTGERTLVAGDQLETASIQGALVSGVRAADAIGRLLAG
ncbi:flavin monoamine oxidase family protein [Labedella endophytica]|uniref:FAD-binding protein n=1 Tax=Labedella endophytica TaxID=1523160 RepID=A0A3S0WWL0_9MICO|nr:NAD(P)/FAD-dependent oxidoreductase [Labedella endophytica]RUQ99215.1 FAD-binding protein [Labedella endophytica]